MKINLILLLGLIFTCISCNRKQEKTTITSASARAFQPPIENVDVPFTDRTVIAERGDTLFYNSGVIVILPGDAFIDEDGNIIKGNVQLSFRELNNPIAMYVSGIPMNYDSAGTNYIFESSSMCEIFAFKDGLPVYVNPNSKPEIILSSRNKSATHNLYYFDTTQIRWINEGIPRLVNLDELEKRRSGDSENFVATAPVRPEKANDNSPVVRVLIEPGSFKELLVHDNMQFQIDPSDDNFKPEDASEEWSNVELLKAAGDGNYMLKFQNAKKTVSYRAEPVLVGKDYDAALVSFDKKRIEYEALRKARITKSKDDSLKYAAYLRKNSEIEKYNQLTKARNQNMKEQNSIVEEIYENTRISRSFQISRFGAWNTDVPVIQQMIPISANFLDSDGKPITLNNIAVFCKEVNSIIRFDNNNIGVVKNTPNMIIGEANGRFAFLGYDEYVKLNVSDKTKAQTFQMKVVTNDDNTNTSIKKIAGFN